MTPEQRVMRFIQEQQLVHSQQKLVVAVSGGPDSVCLLHILVKLQKELGIELHVAHLNHQLRGAESEADARYVTELAHRLDIPATIERRDVKAYQARHHTSLEEAAREVRYTFLAQVAGAVGAERVAVGHTIDDHVETILMHLIRGSGIRGLRGLLPLSQRPPLSASLVVIRPLLELSREETSAYCQQYRLNPRTDESNTSLMPFRNRIRHELLPQLQSYNPQVAEARLSALCHRGTISEESTIDDLVRPAYFAPESKHIDELFAEMRDENYRMCVVVDEYGGTAGVVSLSRLVEEIVGEVGDELAGIEKDYEIINEYTFQIDGSMRIEEANEEMELDLPEGEDYETVAGFILSLLGHIPRRNEQLRYKGMKMVITEMRGQKIEKILLTKERQAAAAQRNRRKTKEEPKNETTENQKA